MVQPMRRGMVEVLVLVWLVRPRQRPLTEVGGDLNDEWCATVRSSHLLLEQMQLPARNQRLHSEGHDGG